MKEWLPWRITHADLAGTQCFWFWHPDHEFRFMGDTRNVVENLWDYDNRKAWKTAQDLQRCI